jgi:hypothetical protein
VSWNIFLIYYLFSQPETLCSQVENSSTAQVGGPHDADVVEPVLAGSDVPLPEDGFTHEVNCFNLPYFESRIFNAFSF